MDALATSQLTCGVTLAAKIAKGVLVLAVLALVGLGGMYGLLAVACYGFGKCP
jgi:hypothetical protein